ncbi:MAG: hypothetical protein ABIP63_01115 [Thermoanaerobaculia bacterium]
MKRLLPGFLLLFSAMPLLAWGEKGHYLVNEAATMSLPTDMPRFFYEAFPQLVWTAYDPDRWKGAGESIDAANSPDHFLDYEFVEGLELRPDRYRFISLLSTSQTLRRHGIFNSTSGFLPWRIAEISERLTGEFRQWRSATPASPERRFLEADIIRDAGVLGHFAGDASNPHHATINYNGWVLPNPNGYATDCSTHDRFERYFISHAVATADVAPRVAKNATLRADYFGAAMAMVRESNSLVEQLYTIDRDGAFDLFKPVSPIGLDFATARIAAGAGLLRDLWWSAWKNSEKPPKRVAAE